MKFTIKQNELLKPLQLVLGAVEKRQTLPILANVLLSVKKQQLLVTATDLEIELIGHALLQQWADEPGEITVPARKLVDICRSIPPDAEITLSFEEKSKRLIVRFGKSRFTLATLPADEFPNVEKQQTGDVKFSLPQRELKFLIEKTHFAMAQQDVRYFLNGMLIVINQGVIRLVAADGHRFASACLPNLKLPIDQDVQVIVPRKGIIELMRLLEDDDKEINITVGTNHICAATSEFVFTSKLIDGAFPNYNKLIPKNGDKEIVVDLEKFKRTLMRVSILSNETYRGVRLALTANSLKLSTNNPEQEEAEEEEEINYAGADLEIGFNVSYFIDICNTASANTLRLTFSDAEGGILLEEADKDNIQYVVMPMRI
jgi:DNA polymerase-3 subunit beta